MTVERTPWTPEMIEQLRALKAEGKMAQEIADIMGMTLTTIHTAWQRYRPGPNRGPMSPLTADVMSKYDEARGKIKLLETDKRTLTETILQTLKRARPYEIPVKTEANSLRFGAIGDTQIGSLYQRLDALKAFYERCWNEGIQTIFHTGDVLAGWRVYKGQEFELHPKGRSWAEQRQMFADAVPFHDRLSTIFITGNHDASFKNLTGMVPGEELQRTRQDWKFIGEDVGTTVLKTQDGQRFTVQLLHPGGGTAYAISYHVQKTIDAMAGGAKPDLLCIGHYHKAEFLPAYRNVAALQTGTFEDQSPFMVRRSIAAHVGGWIVTVSLNDRKYLTRRIQTEWIGFFEPQRRKP
jgi:UDP-2,3-diacylglucosamine pyrophosphatase LpxH